MLPKSAMLAAVLLCLEAAAASYIAPNYRIPGLDPKEVPQMILFTHDDQVDKVASRAVTEITRRHSNPNGCTINAAFYANRLRSDCKYVKSLWNVGHEIASHTWSHHDLSKLSLSEKKKEILGVRDWLASCGVPKRDIRGHRSPYLADDEDVRAILTAAGFAYDSSIPEVFPSPTSPSATRRLFPYSLDRGVAQKYSCSYYDDINNCRAGEKHRGLMEIPVWAYQYGPDRSLDDIMDPADPFTSLKREFDRNYGANRAPAFIWTHTSTGYLTKKSVRDGISRFLSYALAHKDVWVVTPSQLADYMRNPVPASKMAAFMKKYTCSKKGVPHLKF